MMSKSLLAVTIGLVMLLAGCSKSPEKARQELAKMNIPYTIDDFLERAEQGDLVAIELFLAAGMPPDTRGIGETVLAPGEEGYFYALLRDRAKRYRDRTALTLAAENGHAAVVKALLEAGANVNGQEGGGNTALMWAAENGHTNIVSLLIEEDANVNLKNGHDETALMWAARSNKTDAVQALLKAGADINAQNHKGITSLAIAAENGHADLVKLLLDRGADPMATANTGRALLCGAAKMGDEALVKHLLGKGISPNIKCEVQQPEQPLILGAVKAGHVQIVRLLLDAGVEGLKEEDYAEIIELLKKAGAKE